jgi:hypothetical protein
MMKKFYVNRKAQSNGDHEVHVKNCDYFPSDAKDLGEFTSCEGAVKEAKKTYSTADGCKICCPDCHTS